jgi:hypothetical protein
LVYKGYILPDPQPVWESGASSTKKNPTFKIKRLGSGNQLKDASFSKEREKAEKALRLNSTGLLY